MRIKPGKNCYHAALSLLARRDHSCGELDRKLAQRGYPENEIRAAIDECRRLDYLNDRRFALGFSRELQRKGFGRRHLRRMLKSRYVPEEIAVATIENHCSDAVEESQCRRMLEKKLRSLKDDKRHNNKKTKLYRYLLGRGFSPEVIQRAIDGVPLDGGINGSTAAF